MDPHIWSADDHAARCGPGRRYALPAMPLRAGPSRVVPMSLAGYQGTESLRFRPNHGTHPQSLAETKTSGESTKQAEKSIACGTPGDPVYSW